MKLYPLYLIILVVLLPACQKEVEDLTSPVTEETALEELDIPEDFSFETAQPVTLSISDASVAKYTVSDEFGVLGTLFTTESKVQGQFVVALSSTSLQLERRGISGETQSIDVPISSGMAQYEHTATAARDDCTDRLYAVNNQGGFYEIDNETGTFGITNLPTLQGGGSIACALDQENGYLYYNVGKTMYRYDLVNGGGFETVFTSNPFGGSYPRLEYHNGKFYMSNNSGKLYVVNATNNQIEETYNITGFVNNAGGGDLAFASDGKLYLACFSGLYQFTSFDAANEVAIIERISAENFPYQLTSMAIDRNDDIFVATNDAESKLLRMTIQDGSHEISATYPHKINDLTAWRCSVEDLGDQDSDGDGIIDVLDDYPDDPEKAAETFTPSELGWGSLGYEDLWPNTGDYDFNDLVMHYRITQVANAQNEVVEIKMNFKISALNAGYKNGFGVELPIDGALIQSVTGSQLTEDNITLDSKGLEADQDQPVIIVFDNAFQHGNYGECVTQPDETIEIVVDLVNPTDPSLLGSPPYNPFIFVNGDRGKEVHLMDHEPTSKANQSYFGSDADITDGGLGNYYKTSGNLPWAIHIIHNFRPPRSGRAVNRGYNKFNQWATSGGGSFKDWYKDNSGYRSMEHLCTN